MDDSRRLGAYASGTIWAQMMLKLPGSELAKAMLTICPDIPIILYTGHSPMVDEEKAQSISK